MNTIKIAISVDGSLIKKIDYLVRKHIFPNRSKAFQQAVQKKINRLEHKRLQKECSKLNPKYEQAFAEEGFSGEVSEWPEY